MGVPPPPPPGHFNKKMLFYLVVFRQISVIYQWVAVLFQITVIREFPYRSSHPQFIYTLPPCRSSCSLVCKCGFRFILSVSDGALKHYQVEALAGSKDSPVCGVSENITGWLSTVDPFVSFLMKRGNGKKSNAFENRKNMFAFFPIPLFIRKVPLSVSIVYLSGLQRRIDRRDQVGWRMTATMHMCTAIHNILRCPVNTHSPFVSIRRIWVNSGMSGRFALHSILLHDIYSSASIPGCKYQA